jgi:hypothetical protein
MLRAICFESQYVQLVVFLLEAATFEFNGGLTPVKEVRKTMIRAMRSLPLFALAFACSTALLSNAAAMAQNASPTVRIVNPVDERDLVTLKGNTHPFATQRTIAGW